MNGSNNCLVINFATEPFEFSLLVIFYCGELNFPERLRNEFLDLFSLVNAET